MFCPRRTEKKDKLSGPRRKMKDFARAFAAHSPHFFIHLFYPMLGALLCCLAHRDREWAVEFLLSRRLLCAHKLHSLVWNCVIAVDLLDGCIDGWLNGNGYLLSWYGLLQLLRLGAAVNWTHQSSRHTEWLMWESNWKRRNSWRKLHRGIQDVVFESHQQIIRIVFCFY